MNTIKTILSSFLVCFVASCYGAVGIFQTYVNYDIGGGATYEAGGFNADAAPLFDGKSIGIVTSLTLNGGEIKSYKNSGGNITGAKLYYRVYETSSTPGAFTELDLPFGANIGNCCGNEDQRWDATVAGVDLLQCLSPGTYYLEVYWRILTNEGDVYDSNGGANYKGTFILTGSSSAGNGNWGSGGTWTSAPTSSDIIKIESGDTVYLDMNDTIAGLLLNGVLVFNGTETLTILNSLNCTGDIFTINGTLTAGTGTVIFEGPATISGVVEFNNVVIKGSVDFGTTATVIDTFTIASGNVQNNPPLYGSNSTLEYANGYPSGAPYGRFLEWDGAAVPHNVLISNGSYIDIPNGAPTIDRPMTGDFVLDSGGILMYNMDHAIIVDGSVTIKPDGNLFMGTIVGGDLHIKKDFTLEEGGWFFANNRMVLFNGSTYQNINSVGSVSFTDTNKFSFIDIEHTGPGVLVNTDIELEDDVRFRGGQFILNDYDFTFTNTAAIDLTDVPTDNSNIVTTNTGEVRKNFTTTGSFTFPLGDSTGTKEYTPITINMTSGTFGTNAYLATQVFNIKHPGNPNNMHYLDRYWIAHENDITSFTYDIDCSYKTADIVGTETSLRELKSDDNGSSWSDLGAVNDAANLIDLSALTGFSVFTAGANSIVKLDENLFSLKPKTEVATVDLQLTMSESNVFYHFHANEDGQGRFQLYDVTGKLIGSKLISFTTGDNNGSILLHPYSTQVLIVQFKSGNQFIHRKIGNLNE